jgi:thiol:disulfide interchange protein DsbD
MKKIFAFAITLVVLNVVNAQVKNPVQWVFNAKKINATTYEVHLTATIENGWHVYSQTTPEGGPVPTSIEFAKNPLLVVDGSITEIGKLEQHHEPLFGVDVKQFSNKVDFVQTVKISQNSTERKRGIYDLQRS